MLTLSLIVSGALVGFVVGLTGVGGGALMTPVLLLFFGFAPMTAVGTDLWFAAITKMTAGHIHGRSGLIDWSVTRDLWAGSLPASAGTMLLLQTLPPLDGGIKSVLQWIISIAILLTAAGMLFHNQMHGLGLHARTTQAIRFKRAQRPLTILAGAILGCLVTLTSIGAGALGAVFLTYLYPFRLTPPRLIATDIVHAIPLAVFAGAGHALMGNVNIGLLVNLLMGSIPAVLVGAWLSSRLPHHWLRLTLGLVLVAVGFKLLAAA